MAEALDTVSAGTAIAALLSGEQASEEKETQTAAEPVEAAEDAPVESVEPKATADEAAQLVTVKIDGKEIQLPLEEVKAGYQRQADYTRKAMEVAEQRKAAEAEISKASQERLDYARQLQQMQHRLEGALQEQKQTNWQDLLTSDPVEYLRQRHLHDERQAQLQQNYAEQQRLAQQFEVEAQTARQKLLSEQREALLAKLPEWKDEAKAAAEKAALQAYLLDQGYGKDDIANVVDAKAVVMARKAMLYDQMMSKAQAAAKKVATLPAKVERPGAGETNTLDKRTAAFQKLSKSGRVEDAAAVFASLI